MKGWKMGLIILVSIAAPTLWMTYNVLSDVEVTCKVCMSFKGNHNCGSSEAKNKESCLETAKDNACALIANGMDASIQCSQKEPDSTDVQAK